MAAHSSILAWRIPMDSPLGLGRAWRATVHKIAKSQTRFEVTYMHKSPPPGS